LCGDTVVGQVVVCSGCSSQRVVNFHPLENVVATNIKSHPNDEEVMVSAVRSQELEPVETIASIFFPKPLEESCMSLHPFLDRFKITEGI
jgi:hypothetical protein